MYSFDNDIGGYDIALDGQVLLLNIRGVIEVEIVLRFMLQAKVLVDQLPANHWASLVDLSEWGLHPPEVVAFMHEFQQWAEENGQLAEAAVVNKSVLKIMAREKVAEEGWKTVHLEYFETKPAAQEWLRALSFI